MSLNVVREILKFWRKRKRDDGIMMWVEKTRYKSVEGKDWGHRIRQKEADRVYTEEIIRRRAQYLDTAFRCQNKEEHCRKPAKFAAGTSICLAPRYIPGLVIKVSPFCFRVQGFDIVWCEWCSKTKHQMQVCFLHRDRADGLVPLKPVAQML